MNLPKRRVDSQHVLMYPAATLGMDVPEEGGANAWNGEGEDFEPAFKASFKLGVGRTIITLEGASAAGHDAFFPAEVDRGIVYQEGNHFGDLLAAGAVIEGRLDFVETSANVLMLLVDEGMAGLEIGVPGDHFGLRSTREQATLSGIAKLFIGNWIFRGSEPGGVGGKPGFAPGLTGPGLFALIAR
jgi:hypothetical protein